MLDIDTCVAEARTLHPLPDGFFATLRKRPGLKPSQALFHMSSLEGAVHALDSAPDCYLSQSSFVSRNRKVSSFKTVNCAWVDIDCYSSKPNSPNISPTKEFIDDLIANALAAGLPEPSYVTSSGRGLYLKWVFDKPIPSHQLPRWQELQNVLTPLYTKFGVDASARDAARVLRVMGSSHGANNARVQVVRNSGKVHDFDALCKLAAAVEVNSLRWPSSAKNGTPGAARPAGERRRLKPDTTLLLASPGNAKVLADYAAAHEPVMLKVGTLDHLNWSRFIDLRTLAQMRGGVHEGSRDLMMFWMADFLGLSRIATSSNLEQEVTGLLGAFDGVGKDFDPIGSGSLSTLKARMADREAGKTVRFEGGTYDSLYTPSNDHLIDVLGITREEQERMVTVIDGVEKLRRADAKVEGRADRRVARAEWRFAARQEADKQTAAGETVNYSKIGRLVNVDRRQVAKLLTGQLDRDPKRIETRGRKKCISDKGRRVVLSRRGGFSSSIWIASGATAAEVIAAAAQRATELTARARSAAAGAPVPPSTASAQDQTPHSTHTPSETLPKKLSIAERIAISHPHRVIISIARKRRAESDQEGKKAGSKLGGKFFDAESEGCQGSQASGLPETEKFQAPRQTPSPWAALAARSKEDDEHRQKLRRLGIPYFPVPRGGREHKLGDGFPECNGDPVKIKAAIEALLEGVCRAHPECVPPPTREECDARLSQLKESMADGSAYEHIQRRRDIRAAQDAEQRRFYARMDRRPAAASGSTLVDALREKGIDKPAAMDSSVISAPSPAPGPAIAIGAPPQLQTA